MTLNKFLKTIAPNFCWCTSKDLFLMYEQMNENIDIYVFRITLHNMVKQGQFKTKKDESSRHAKAMLYLRTI